MFGQLQVIQSGWGVGGRTEIQTSKDTLGLGSKNNYKGRSLAGENWASGMRGKGCPWHVGIAISLRKITRGEEVGVVLAM